MTYPFSQGHIVSEGETRTVVRPYDDTAARWPSGILFSSVNELARFTIAFMSSGWISGNPVLSPAVIAKMSTPQAVQPDGVQYGYGLGMGDERGVHTVQHNGARRGFCSYLLMAPEHRFAVIALANQLEAVRVLAAAAGEAMKLRLPLSPELGAKPTPALPLSQTALEDYVGAYEKPDVNATDENAEIFRKGNQLFYKVGDSESPIIFIGEDSFVIEQPSTARPKFVISRGADGKVAYIHFSSRAWKKTNAQSCQD